MNLCALQFTISSLSGPGQVVDQKNQLTMGVGVFDGILSPTGGIN